MRIPSVILFVLLVATGCGGEHSSDVIIEEIEGVTYVRNGSAIDTTAFPFDLVFEQSFGAEEEPLEATLTYVSNLTTDSQGNVYLIESDHEHLLSFDREGAFRWSAGDPGDGPGEFSGAIGMVLAGNETLLISNGRGARLDRWDTSGNFIDSRAMPPDAGPWATVKGSFGNDRLVFSGHMPGRIGSRASLIDPESLSILDSLSFVQTIDAPNSEYFYSPVDVLVDNESLIFGSASGEYQLKLVEPGTGSETIVSRDVQLLHRPVVVIGDGGYGVFNFSQFEILGRAMSSQLVTYVSSALIDDVQEYANSMSNSSEPEVDHFSSLDAFDSAGRYVGSKWWNEETPDIGRPITIAPDGKLYTYARSPYPHIRRYRFEAR